MTDHREDIREAARRYTDAARLAFLGERDDVHAFTPDADEDPDYCGECREFGEAGDGAHWPADVDPAEYADGLAGLLLDVDLLTSPTDPDRWRAELLLTCGGPTVRVTVDSRESGATFSHSWGMDADGADLRECELWGDDAEVWRDIAEMFADLAAQGIAWGER